MNALIKIEHPPLQNWNHPAFAAQQVQVDVLRLDQMHPVLGGNKWMKLRGFVQQAVQEGKTGILTKGGPWSNHVHAAARAAWEVGLSFFVWIKGYAGLQTAMLTDVQQWGGTLRFVHRSVFYDEAAANNFAAANNLLYMPMGGAQERGVQESTRFFEELQLPHYDYAACAVGTATTFGGLAFVPGNFEQVVGIDAGTHDATTTEKIAGWQAVLPHKKLELLSGYDSGGFGKRTPELVQFANDTFRHYGIATDLVYTAKLLSATLQLAQQTYFAPGSAVLLLHSGGLQGNRSLPVGTLQF